MYCTKCGKEITDNSKFCKYCGNENMKKKSIPKESQKIISVVIIVILIFAVGRTITGTKNKSEHSNKQTKSSIISVGCPYCDVHVNLNKENGIERANVYIVKCPNCGKSLGIDKKTNRVKLTLY